jgi:hypothetical protein
MQYWIFFYGGVGGDGFSNLLEHADNIIPSDGFSGWRIHWQEESVVKFYGPTWTNHPIPFRYLNPVVDNITLNENYQHILTNNLNTVIPTHYNFWNQIDKSPLEDIVTRKQIKIHLYSKNYIRVTNDLIIKNKIDKTSLSFKDAILDTENAIESQLQNRSYDTCIDIEKVWDSWNYLDDCLKRLDINLDKCYYNEYLKISKKN